MSVSAPRHANEMKITKWRVGEENRSQEGEGMELDKVPGQEVKIKLPLSSQGLCVSASSVNETRNSNEGGSKATAHDAESLCQTVTNSPPWSVFTIRQKRFIVLMVALAGFFSPLSANIYFPALNTLSSYFKVSSGIINLTLTSYMIFQGLAPTVFGDLADMAGRRPAYLIGFAFYIGACIGIACSETFPALLVLRCLQASGSSGTIALGSGVVADIATSAERGVWMGWATSGPMIAPAIAPIIGGVFAELVGWRWIFWFLVIAAGTFVVPFALAFPETGRNVVGNGSIRPQGWNMSLLNYLQVRKTYKNPERLEQSRTKDSPRALAGKRQLRFPNPLQALKLVMEKDVGLLLFYNSVIYCAFYDVMASAPMLLEQIYGYDALQIGLCFLPFGLGCALAPQTSGKIMDWNFRRRARKIGYKIFKGKANDLRSFPLEQARIEVALPMVFIGDAALLCYGWVMQVHTNLAAPLVLMFIIGLTMTGAFNVLSVMLIDLYPLSPSTATAANNLIRCLAGAGTTDAVIYMIEAMGQGWCFTLHAGVVVVLSPSLWILQRWGPGWRESRRLRTHNRNESNESRDHAGDVSVLEAKAQVAIQRGEEQQR
ncbi:hypothetical protein M433DRAFT_157259 [Acidomyces richmondensis BFW]|nr:MAG: hypothetical protein FE78DRAFT_93043 [Acidomyces sp. 'richmondensis']KYG42987.1 hypothetical protein M433DRAFT_157259 [Acidomyces richmondensis BFW]